MLNQPRGYMPRCASGCPGALLSNKQLFPLFGASLRGDAVTVTNRVCALLLLFHPPPKHHILHPQTYPGVSWGYPMGCPRGSLGGLQRVSWRVSLGVLWGCHSLSPPPTVGSVRGMLVKGLEFAVFGLSGGCLRGCLGGCLRGCCGRHRWGYLGR